MVKKKLRIVTDSFCQNTDSKWYSFAIQGRNYAMRGLPRNDLPGPQRPIFHQTSSEDQKKKVFTPSDVFSKVITWNCFSKVTVKHISREDVAYFLSVTCIRLGTHESMFGGKNVGKREDLFFFFFWSSFDNYEKIGRRKA